MLTTHEQHDVIRLTVSLEDYVPKQARRSSQIKEISPAVIIA